MSLPKRLSWDLAQDRWATELDPLLKNPLNQGVMIPNVSLINGVTVINHRLGRKQVGYIITDINAAAIIYRSQALNDLTLTLTSNAACQISIWCF